MEQKNHPNLPSPIHDGIDLHKLWMILKRNWIWMALIFTLTVSVAYLKFIRYTPEIFQSSSELKLDIKREASEFGIKSFAEDQNLNIISEEIELIQSTLFLNQALDSLPLDVTYFNKGEFMNFEFFGNPPYFVEYDMREPMLYNTPIFVDETQNGIRLRIRENGPETETRYNEVVTLPGMRLKIIKNENFGAREDLNSFFIINSRDVQLNYLSDNLSAEPVDIRANIISISFKDNNPFKARMIVNKIDSLYLQYSNAQKNLANKQKIDWLTRELQQIESRMESYENYFENFVIENKTNDINEDLKKTVAQLIWVDSQRFEVTRQLGQLDELNADMEKGKLFLSIGQYQSLPAPIKENLDALQRLQLEVDKLKLSYKESTFAYRGKQKEIESITKKLNAQIVELKNAMQKKLANFNLTKARLENEFTNMPDKNTEYTKNQRFYKLYEEFYLMMMQSKSEFEIAQAGTIPDFKILSPASLPRVPIAPNKFMIMGIGVVVGFMLNFFFIGIAYLLNNKVTSVNELEKLTSVPVLGVIPASSSKRPQKDLHIVAHPRSMVSESLRTLRTNLDFFGLTSNSRIIAISSTISGEGKSFVAANLAATLALSKKKVIMLDLDMRKAKNTLPGNTDPSKGISTILIRKNSWQECITKTALENFEYIASGPQPPNPSELLLNGEFSSMLEELKQVYDYIILDTPPVGLVTDGIMAMKRADISIYVFRANYSKKDFLSTLQRIININKFSNITTLLNALPSSENGYGYYEVESKGLRSIFKG